MAGMKLQIRRALLYEYNQGRSINESVKIINIVFNENPISKEMAKYWFRKFRTGNYDLKDAARSGRPAKVNDDILQVVVESNPSASAKDIGHIIGCSDYSVISHLKNIGFVKRVPESIPQFLTEKQRKNRVEICRNLIKRLTESDFINRIITCDETYINFNCSNSRKKKEWVLKSTYPKPRPKPKHLQRKVMFSLWFNKNGVLFTSFTPVGITIDSTRYCQQLESLHSILKSDHSDLLEKGVLLHQDNAKPHVSRLTKETIKKMGFQLLPHPPCSPDMAPCDFYIFGRLKDYLKDKIMHNEDHVKDCIKEFFYQEAKIFILMPSPSWLEDGKRLSELKGTMYLDGLCRIMHNNFLL